MSNVKRNILMAVVMIVLVSGCASQRTTGKGHKLLPFGFGISVHGALASGESESKVGFGKNAVEDVMNADNQFNPTWSKVGVAEAKNKMQTVTYSGPQQTNPNLSYYSSPAVENALEMEK